jgi:hypothetical protein
VNWASNVGQGITDGEERFVASMFREDIDNESD